MGNRRRCPSDSPQAASSVGVVFPLGTLSEFVGDCTFSVGLFCCFFLYYYSESGRLQHAEVCRPTLKVCGVFAVGSLFQRLSLGNLLKTRDIVEK